MGGSNDARNQDRPGEQNHRGNRDRRRPERLSEFRSIIGAEELELIPLDKGINLLADLHGEQKPCFGFCGLDAPVVHGVAVVLGGSPRRLRALRENKESFDMIVDWR